jgi:hypothetical protein
MKNMFLYLICGFMMTFNSVQGDETFNGPTQLTKGNYKDLVINGPAQLNKIMTNSIVVRGPLNFSEIVATQFADIKGPVKGDHGKFGKLQVMGTLEGDYILSDELHVKGPVNVSYLLVNKDAEIMGPLNVQKGKFHNLIITADKINLEDVYADRIEVKQGTEQSQILTLKGSTIINGDIIFESGNGVIVKSSTAQILGSVKGAKVDQK